MTRQPCCDGLVGNQELWHSLKNGVPMSNMPEISDPAVAAAYASFTSSARAPLLHLRGLILDTAAATPAVGPIVETLKWGQPAYLTQKTKAGTTLRLGQPKRGGFAIFVHCQTTVISDFRALFPDDFDYDGNRAVLFQDRAGIDDDNLRLLIGAALTYHLRRPNRGAPRAPAGYRMPS